MVTGVRAGVAGASLRIGRRLPTPAGDAAATAPAAAAGIGDAGVEEAPLGAAAAPAIGTLNLNFASFLFDPIATSGGRAGIPFATDVLRSLPSLASPPALTDAAAAPASVLAAAAAAGVAGAPAGPTLALRAEIEEAAAREA